MNEAMALAAISPMVGTSPPTSHSGYIINVTNYDKDLKQGKTPSEFTGFTNTLDNDDTICGLDPYGRMCIKNKSELFNGKNIVVEVFGFYNKDTDTKYKKLLDECYSKKKKRHAKTYLYETFSDKKAYTIDQIRYDPMFESIDLEKMSNAIQGVSQSMMGKVRGLQHKQSGSRYTPDNDFPQRTDEIHDLSESYSDDELYLLEMLSYRKFTDVGSTTIYNMIE